MEDNIEYQQNNFKSSFLSCLQIFQSGSIEHQLTSAEIQVMSNGAKLEDCKQDKTAV